MDRKTETFVLNMGPQHPSTHGVLQVALELDGERIVKATPVLGYLHRGIEKLLEDRTYMQCMPYMDKLDYVSAMNNNLGFCEAVEELAGIEVPERALYIRVIVSELSRIAGHLLFIGTLLNDLGAATAFIYAFRDREKVLDLMDHVCGGRMSFNYIRFGGVSADVQPDFLGETWQFLYALPEIMDEYDRLITGNEIFEARTKGVSVITPQQAKDLNLSGPNLRASNVCYDIRKVEPYCIYDRFDFDVPTGENGDDFDRYMVRYNEIIQSARIVRQALEQLPEGPIKGKVPPMLKPPKGDVYHRVEGARGELGFYVVSDGTNKPYRVHIRRPSFVNMQAIDPMCRGMLIADSVAVYSTIDPIMGETDC